MSTRPPPGETLPGRQQAIVARHRIPADFLTPRAALASLLQEVASQPRYAKGRPGVGRPVFSTTLGASPQGLRA
jgi:hypothetical protein